MKKLTLMEYSFSFVIMCILLVLPLIIYKIVIQEKTREKVMLSYIEKNKNQILTKTQSKYLICNKYNCVANYQSLLSNKLINTDREKNAFKKGQFYIFDIKDEKIDYRIIGNEKEMKDYKDLFQLSLFISAVM